MVEYVSDWREGRVMGDVKRRVRRLEEAAKPQEPVSVSICWGECDDCDRRDDCNRDDRIVLKWPEEEQSVRGEVVDAP